LLRFVEKLFVPNGSLSPRRTPLPCRCTNLLPFESQKLIKELPALVPVDDSRKKQRARAESQEGERPGSPSSMESSIASDFSLSMTRQQHHGDKTTEAIKDDAPTEVGHEAAELSSKNKADSINKSPGEVAFFKLLHAEFKKATHFFDKAQQEFVIREERVREGMEIIKRPNSIMVSEKWSLLAKSLYRLYKDLLLLETFAIMTYCSFSKILKKHDKVTGYNTRNAFMENVVNNANFTNYPAVLEMIKRCERMYEEVSQHLLKEGKEGLYEDERLFINMIHRLNEQCMDTAEVEGVPLRQQELRRPSVEPAAVAAKTTEKKLSSLQSLMADMTKQRAAGQVSDAATADESDSDRKRAASCDGCPLPIEKKLRSK
jgi:hypothetical protein